MNLKIMLPVALLLLASTWIACRKDNFSPSEKNVEVTIAGRVTDQAGTALPGATVEAGDQTVVTDVNGIFRLKPVQTPAQHATFKVSKQGFFDCTKTCIVQDKSTIQTTVQLLTKDLVANLPNSQGGTVAVSGGATLRFPQNSVTNQDGSAYNGNVQVYAHYLDPTDPNLHLFMPGDQRGVNDAGTEGALTSFGMIGVELSGNGLAVKVAEGKTVEIDLPIQPSQVAAAPSEIPLWYFDTDRGLWIEQGTAQKVGNHYIGQVKHFSFWNCDAYTETVYLQGNVFVADGDTKRPLTGVTIRLKVISNGYQGHAISNGNGWFGGKVPKNEAMLLEILGDGNCNQQVLFSQTIGPFASQTTLPDLVLSKSDIFATHVSGQLVDCTMQPVSNGYVTYDYNGSTVVAFADPSGKFSIEQLNCSQASIAAQIVGYDIDNLLQSTPLNIQIAGNTTDIGTITLCSTLSQFVLINLDGKKYLFTKAEGYTIVNAPTFIDASEVNQQTDFVFTMQFDDQNASTGTFPVTAMYLSGSLLDSAGLVLNIQTQVNHFGPVNDYISGSLNGTFTKLGSNHTITGSYKVIHKY